MGGPRVDWSRWDAQLGTMPDADLAYQIGCTPWAVRKRRRKIDRPSVGQDKPIDWGQYDEMLGTVPDSEVAAMVGCTTTAVRSRRHRLGQNGGRGPVTPKVIPLDREELRIGALLYPERNYWRPETRADCASVPRPCPYVGCRHHLYLDVNPDTGSIKMNHPDKEVWELERSCSLDEAEAGESAQHEVAEMVSTSRARVGQIEMAAFARLEREGDPRDATT